ncbi:MAG TPA: hypothetical protein VFG11_08570 [Acidobacteriota bacterium]|nr:hypothetical protein [Acidobacteriota bacterium]
MRTAAVLFLLFSLMAFAAPLNRVSYQSLNPQLGVVYRQPSIAWDGQQWNAIFRDPNTPVGWAVLPVGNEGCAAIEHDWLQSAKRKGLRLGLLIDPFVSAATTRQIVDCAAPLGFTRAVWDEYVSYQTSTLGRPLCTVVDEVRSTYDAVKARHPAFEFGIDDQWPAWMTQLGKGTANPCGAFPYFKVDLAGISVLSKYGNPAQKVCGHPTTSEMYEQITDLKPIVSAYSSTGRIFIWELNQNWYPGQEDVLQFFRQLKPIFGWEPFLLFGPTTTLPREENWGYETPGGPQDCASAGYEWYLPARDYLIRISEGRRTSLRIQGPASTSIGSVVTLNGNINTGRGETIQLQVKPPNTAIQHFFANLTAPANARFAIVGLRVNSQTAGNVHGVAQFFWDGVSLIRAGRTSNLIFNSNFSDGFAGWLVNATTPVQVVTRGSAKGLAATCSPQQFISITSIPVLISGGKSYTVDFDAAILQEARVNGYFYVGWTTLSDEIRRDRLFMNFPARQTVSSTVTGSNGSFQFSWQPDAPGLYRVFGFYPGTRSYQPAIGSKQIQVN